MTDGTAFSRPRTLGLFDTTCIVIGSIVGVGIFFSPGKVAALVPTPGLVLAAWAIAGVLALAGALAFAELGRRRTGHGAQHQVLRDAFGPLVGFIFVFCNSTAVQAGSIGIIGMICARNLGMALAPGKLSGTEELWIAVGLIAAIGMTNLAGLRWGARVQNLTVIGKVASLLAIAALAAWYANSAEGRDAAALHAAETAPETALTPMAGIVAALVPAFFAYGGWQSALWMSGEVKEPERNLPRAVLLGTCLVVVIYLIANAAYLALLGHQGVASSRTLAADAVAVVYPTIGARIVAGAVAVSAFGVMNAQLLGGPRLIAALASDGLLPRVFAQRADARAPSGAIVLLMGISITLLLIAGEKGLEKLTTGVVAVDGLFFALTALAIYFIKPVGKPLPLAGIAAAVFIVGELALLYGSTLDKETRIASLIGAGWVVGACVLYFVFRNTLGKKARPMDG